MRIVHGYRLRDYPDPTEADRRWWADQNDEWHDQDASPALDCWVRVGPGWRRVRIDRRDEGLDPERFEYQAV